MYTPVNCSLSLVQVLIHQSNPTLLHCLLHKILVWSDPSTQAGSAGSSGECHRLLFPPSGKSHSRHSAMLQWIKTTATHSQVSKVTVGVAVLCPSLRIYSVNIIMGWDLKKICLQERKISTLYGSDGGSLFKCSHCLQALFDEDKLSSFRRP